MIHKPQDTSNQSSSGTIDARWEPAGAAFSVPLFALQGPGRSLPEVDGKQPAAAMYAAVYPRGTLVGPTPAERAAAAAAAAAVQPLPPPPPMFIPPAVAIAQAAIAPAAVQPVEDENEIELD